MRIFFDKSNTIVIDKNRIDEIYENIVTYVKSKGIEDLDFIEKNIIQLKYPSINLYLKPYEKLVEQLSQKLEKYINPLVINTQDIYLSDIYKPFFNSLVHLFRNSIDHGIESLEIREQLGKELYGTISCDVEKEKGSLLIKIKDDGAGIDEEKIKSLAVAKNIYTQDEVDNLTKEEVLLIIFQDEFSTSEDITDISGRGVGLASISKELKKLNGSMIINNNLGKGIEFIFKLPFKI